MRCPNCNNELDVSDSEQSFTCLSCGQELLEVRLAVKKTDLKTLHSIMTQAMNEPAFYDQLRQEPRQVLTDTGVSKNMIDALPMVIKEKGIFNPPWWPIPVRLEDEAPDTLVPALNKLLSLSESDFPDPRKRRTLQAKLQESRKILGYFRRVWLE